MEAYIRQAARERGIDPDVAVRVARFEGLRENTWQSYVMQPYGRERSYGPFQLHVAPKGRPQGLGNAFIRQTGLDPSDPATWRQGVDFALNSALRSGWGPWFGAGKAGVGNWTGIKPGAAPVALLSASYARPPAPVPGIRPSLESAMPIPLPQARPAPMSFMDGIRQTFVPQSAGRAGTLGGLLGALGRMGGDSRMPGPVPMQPIRNAPASIPRQWAGAASPYPENGVLQRLLDRLGIQEQG
jgi:hypothetical protein